jgi:hypothetical protein
MTGRAGFSAASKKSNQFASNQFALALGHGIAIMSFRNVRKA